MRFDVRVEVTRDGRELVLEVECAGDGGSYEQECVGVIALERKKIDGQWRHVIPADAGAEVELEDDTVDTNAAWTAYDRARQDYRWSYL